MSRLELGTYHIPVMLRECMQWLQPRPDGLYVDGTLGGGGHTAELLKTGARVIAFDADEEAIRHCRERFGENEKLTLVHANFESMPEVLQGRLQGDIQPHDRIQHPDGILFDLGVSSFQFDHHQRGFSYRMQAPLDMRFSPDGQTAADILNTSTAEEIVHVLKSYGEEPMARRLAEAIVQRRSLAALRTTADLRDVVIQSIPPQHQPKTMARVFQALRIATNIELERLEAVLKGVAPLLAPYGRIVVMSYHSLEDRIVKTVFKELADKGIVNVLTKKPIEPDREEIAKNPRSRSARLRVCERPL
ncbi:MAG: 16S rRNA (cytosine(1402)-N(4))-methyltransferase RsmH [bacterium]|nr:16S rRNA (cytosine(1402)-N(4))-methyltransferase RsmH [bacterium]